MLSKSYVETTLREGGYLDIFFAAVRSAEQSWLETVAGSPDNMAGAKSLEKSVHLNRRIIELVCQVLENNPNVAINTIYGTTLITINNEICLRFKKLNRQLRAMNIKTGRTKRLWYQNAQPLPGDFERWINVTFGWKLGAAGKVEDLHIIFEYQDKLQWSFQVTEAGVVHETPMQLPLVEDNEQIPYMTSIRDTERARRVAKNDAEDNTNEAN